jgi:hypothetical protein
MLNSEVVLLEALNPTSNLTLRLSETQEPVKGCVIRSEQKLSAIQVDMKMLNSFDYCQQLTLSHTIAVLRSTQNLCCNRQPLSLDSQDELREDSPHT